MSDVGGVSVGSPSLCTLAANGGRRIPILQRCSHASTRIRHAAAAQTIRLCRLVCLSSSSLVLCRLLQAHSHTSHAARNLGTRRCSEATIVYRRFLLGLGMQLVAKSDQSTGNSTYASYVLRWARAPALPVPRPKTKRGRPAPSRLVFLRLWALTWCPWRPVIQHFPLRCKNGWTAPSLTGSNGSLRHSVVKQVERPHLRLHLALLARLQDGGR